MIPILFLEKFKITIKFIYVIINIINATLTTYNIGVFKYTVFWEKYSNVIMISDF